MCLGDKPASQPPKPTSGVHHQDRAVRLDPQAGRVTPASRHASRTTSATAWVWPTARSGTAAGEPGEGRDPSTGSHDHSAVAVLHASWGHLAPTLLGRLPGGPGRRPISAQDWPQRACPAMATATPLHRLSPNRSPDLRGQHRPPRPWARIMRAIIGVLGGPALPLGPLMGRDRRDPLRTRASRVASRIVAGSGPATRPRWPPGLGGPAAHRSSTCKPRPCPQARAEFGRDVSNAPGSSYH
jgi:hypothetical protein